MNKTLKKLSELAFKQGVSAANPSKCLIDSTKVHPFPKPNNGKYVIISLGKAACSLIDTAIKLVPNNHDSQLLAITNYENHRMISGCRVLAAGHPIPDQHGIIAGKTVVKLLENASKDDSIILLISGGTSALLPTPIKGLDLNDKIEINKILLNADLSITEINLIRQTMSTLKGGGLSDLIYPNPSYSYIISDVISDDLNVIASGLSASRLGTIEEAFNILDQKNLYSKLSPKLKNFFVSARDYSFKKNSLSKNILIGNNKESLKAMALSANAEIISKPIVGNVKLASQIIVNEIMSRKNLNDFNLAFGGETTVEVLGNGLGGRNQELALRVAQKLDNEKIKGTWSFLSASTDGIDGPTNAAGAIVDNKTISKLASKNLSVDQFLAKNDSNTALKITKDLLVTGPTGTNVADLQLFCLRD